MQRFQGLIGIILILGLSLVFSNNRRRINLRLVFSGLLLQLLIGFMVLKITPVILFFQFLGRIMGKLEQFAFQGASFVGGMPCLRKTGA
jgi:CNT family concentrative nucleoside transporter